MPRSKRVVAVGAPHHVTQRGNGRQDVFVNDGVRRIYLDLIAEHAGRNQLDVAAYCIMTNHVHLVVVPNSERSLANTFRHAHGRFTQLWNTAMHGSGGGVDWQIEQKGVFGAEAVRGCRWPEVRSGQNGDSVRRDKPACCRG